MYGHEPSDIGVRGEPWKDNKRWMPNCIQDLRCTSDIFLTSLLTDCSPYCQSIHELSYDNDIEKAGSVFADVVSLLSVVADVARAARAVGAVDQVLARFGKATATIGEGKGLMLEAKEGENTVQIFRDGGDGKPKLLYTDSDVAAMEKSIEEGGKLPLAGLVHPL